MPFSPPTQSLAQGEVGSKYHLAIGTTTSGLSAPDRVYGYMLASKERLPNIAVGSGSMGGFEESTDLTTRDKVQSSFSPNLVDRDFVNFPRVSDGDFSGGALQTIFIDPHRYWDSDLDISEPGYLRLSPLWNTTSFAGLTSPGVSGKVVAFKGDFWVNFGDASKNFHKANAGTTYTGTVIAKYVATDGTWIYFSDGTNIYLTSGSADTQIASAVNGGPITGMWVIQQGTLGYYLYYTTSSQSSVYKIDLTATFPVAAANQAQLPTGGNNFTYQDICPYQVGIALLANDEDNNAYTVFYHDGQNMTPIVRVEGYRGEGICNCLGDLYVAASARSTATPPTLAKISQGQYSVVASLGSPIPAPSQFTIQPISAGHRVYVRVSNTVNGISSSPPWFYNALNGAVGHVPTAPSDGGSMSNGERNSMDSLGRNLAYCSVNGTTGYINWQSDTFGTVKYASTGWMVGSRMDFNTPGVTKLLKRIIVNHSPLAAGEGVTVQAWIDKNPTDFSTGASQGSGSTQYDAQVVNTTAGSVRTVLQLPAATVGTTLFPALKLTAGTSNLTSPTIFSLSVEVGVPWTWHFTVDCSSQRTCLDGQPDAQGLRGIDLYGLIHDAWENSDLVTLYHPNGNSYTAVIESARFMSSNPNYRDTSFAVADYEAVCDVVLRQSAV